MSESNLNNSHLVKTVYKTNMEISEVNQLMNYIEEFHDLVENWNGYGAIPIYKSIIKKTQWFIQTLPKEYLSMTNTGKISPDTNGTIMIDFENDNGGIISISFGLENENFYYDVNDTTIDESELIHINPEKGIPLRIINSLKKLSHTNKKAV